MGTSGVIIILFMVLCFIILFCLKSKLSWNKRQGRIIINIFAAICLAYFLFARWIWDVMDFVKYFDRPIDDQYRQVYFSKTLLLDLCPFVAMFLPILIMTGGKEKLWAKIIAPVSIIGASITIFGEVIWKNVDISQFMEFFFIGIKPNRAYFMMHFLSAFQAVWVMMCCKKYTLKDQMRTFMFYCVWILYISVCTRTLNITWNATGLVENDWLYGQYEKMYAFTVTYFKPLAQFPIITIFWYSVALFVNLIFTLSKNFSVWLSKYLKTNKKDFMQNPRPLPKNKQNFK